MFVAPEAIPAMQVWRFLSLAMWVCAALKQEAADRSDPPPRWRMHEAACRGE
jgi:hypothetical protein